MPPVRPLFWQGIDLVRETIERFEEQLREALMSGFEKRSFASHVREFGGVLALLVGALAGACFERVALTARKFWNALWGSARPQ